MTAETELKGVSRSALAEFSEDEPTWPSDASPSSRRAVRFENVQEVSECDVRREKGFSPTASASDQHAVYLKVLRDLSTEKQKRRRKEKNMLKLAQELGNRTEQIADCEKQLEALRSEISVLKKKLFDSKNDRSEERDEPGNAECPQQADRLPISPLSLQDEVKRLQNELCAKTQETKILEQNLADGSKAVEMLQAEISTKAEALRSAEAELKRERADMAKLREHIWNLEMACAKHVKDKSDAINRMSSLEIDLVAKDNLLLKQSASFESSEPENLLLNQETENEIKELRQTLKLTQASLIKLGEDAASHKQVLRKLNMEMAQKEESMLAMQTELAKEKAEVERLSTLHTMLDKEKTSTRYDLEEATRDILSLKANDFEKEQLLQDVRDELRRKNADFLASMRINTESFKLLQEEGISKDAKLEKIMAELVCERSTLSAAKEKRHLLEAECKALRIAKDLAVQQNDTLKDEMKTLRSLAMAEKFSEQSDSQPQSSMRSKEGLEEPLEKGNDNENVKSVTEQGTIEAEDQESRIESLESSRQRLLDDCNFLRLSLNKLEEENRSLLFKFNSDEKSFADVESRIQAQQKEATLVREELLGCKVEVQRLVDNDKDCSNALDRAEKLLATQAKSVSDMMANFGSIVRTMENISRLKDMVEVLQQDLHKRDETISELQRRLASLAAKDFTVLKADERPEIEITFNADLDLDVLKEESRRYLETASENLSSALSNLTLSDPTCATMFPAVDRFQATCRDLLSQFLVHLESEVALKFSMKTARDKVMQALSQSNKNMEEASSKMKGLLETLNHEHAQRTEELQEKLSHAIQSKQQAICEHKATLRAVENKFTSKFVKLGKKNEELLTDLESHMQERIDKLGSKLDKKAARMRTIQRLLTHQLQAQGRRRSSRLLWFSVLLIMFAAPIFVLFRKAERQWACAPVPPWENYQSSKDQTWHLWWSSFNKAEAPSAHPWWKWTNNAHLDWIEANLCHSNMN